jgi:hypothetical protein
MMANWQFWLLTALASICTALIGANMYRFSENRVLQAEVNQRTQFIQQTVPLEGLNREIVGALAQLAVRNQDDQIRSMLASLGISMTETPSAPAAPTGTPAPRKK